jgi:predicted amidohydrolase
MTSVDQAKTNYAAMIGLIEKAIKEKKPDLILFPENCLYMRLQEGEKITGFDLSDFYFLELSKIASQNNVALHLGALPLRLHGKLFNASVYIDGFGNISSSYQKIHLFDIQLEGQKANRESDVFTHGEKPAILELKGWQLGQTICYDLRFSELFNFYAKKHVHAILVPSSFLVKTGMAHWEVLLRARAIESQCYILAAAQAGKHQSEKGIRETFGHSLIIDPWGQVLKQAQSSGPEIIYYDLSCHDLDKVRRQIPMKNHRRMT